MQLLTRRHFLSLAITTGLSLCGAVRASDNPIRIGITPVFLTGMTSVLREWQNYLEHKIGQPVSFIQRDTYRDIVNNLLARRLDFAWICGYPYIANHQKLRLTAVPLYQGKPLYRSYLIVPNRDVVSRSILDLKGRVFAYTDPDSNSGFLVPRYQLNKANKDPNTFFRKTFMSNGHRNAIEAVSAGLADGACVDGYVWETLARFNPDITKQTRLVSKSPSFGFPPIVAGPAASMELFHRFQNTLNAMQKDQAALTILDRLNIDGFVSGTMTDYDAIAEMATVLGELHDVS